MLFLFYVRYRFEILQKKHREIQQEQTHKRHLSNCHYSVSPVKLVLQSRNISNRKAHVESLVVCLLIQ